MSMKQIYIGVSIFVMIVFIVLILMVKKPTNLPYTHFSRLILNEIPTCIDINKCISETRLSQVTKNKTRPIKEIKTFLRQKAFK